MSRSCQSGTFSSPGVTAARTTRASPQIRSDSSGLRLCGIALEPFCPCVNGSSASRTSVRCRWRISVAIFSHVAATIAHAVRYSACRSRWITCVAASSSLEAELAAHVLLDEGVDGRVRADRPGDLADADRVPRAHEPVAVARDLERPDGELQAEAGRLGVDAVRASDADRVAELERAALEHGEQRLGLGDEQVGRLAAAAEPARCRAGRRRSSRSGSSGSPARPSRRARSGTR